MAQQILSTNTFTTAKWIVSATSSDGTHTTIATALTSASSGDTIFIRPGTYTENITLKAGVNLTAYDCDSSQNGTGKVIISGTCTLTTAGSVSISGIQLQTNSAALLAVTGSATSIVNLKNCYLNCLNNTGITFSSSDAGAQINIYYCSGNLGTTGIAYFTDSSSGHLSIFYSDFENSGASTTASTKSAGELDIQWSTFKGALTYSSSNTVSSILNSDINTASLNVTCVTTSGTGTLTFHECHISSGSASAISVGSGTTVACRLCIVNSSNTNAITGAGTLRYGIQFSGTSSLTNVSTQTGNNFNIGGVSFDGGSNYLSNYTQGTFSPTIDNSTGSPTVTYTTQVGRYTRIGNRVFVVMILVLNAYTAGTGNVQIKTLPYTSEATTNNNGIGVVTMASVTFGASVLYYNSVVASNATLVTIQGMRSAAGGLNLDAAGPAAGSTIRISLSYEV